MSDKSQWKSFKFFEIADNIVERIMPEPADSKYYIGLEHLDSGSLHISRWGSETELIGEKLRIRKGDILFARRNAYLKRVAVAPFDGIFSAHGMVLRPKENVVLPDFFPFFMQSDIFMDKAIQISVGSLSPTVNWGTLKQQEFILPPIDEQRRIAEILRGADEYIVKLQKLIESLRVFRNKFYANTQTECYFKSNSIPFKTERIKDAFEICNNLRKPLSANVRSTIKGSYPYYGATGILDYINEYRVDGEYALIGEDGDHFLKYEIWNMTHLINGKNNVNNHAHIIKGKNGNLTKWFYYYYKHRDIVPSLLKQGSGRLKLNKSTLEQMKIVLPNVRAQIDLCNKYDEIENSWRISNDALNRAKNLLQNLSCSLLGGELLCLMRIIP